MKPKNIFQIVLPVSILSFVGLLCASFFLYAPVERISMSLVSKALQDGKSITTQAEVYYRVSGGLLVTHITSPIEYLVITNDKGEIKMYDVKANLVSQMQASDFSSENSFIHDFLRGNTNDMGLRRLGFQLRGSKVEENMVVTDWIPPLESNSPVNRIELVHENYSPIYMAFFGKKDKPLSKIFYSNYQKTGDLSIPLTITEFQYHPNGDSTVTKRIYSDIKLNEQVIEKWLNYKIPENAKIIK
jgi:outer membrane lipoprotein-sorting protein